MKKSILATAIVASLAATTAQADIVIDLDGEGFFTMITPTGGVLNNPDFGSNPYYGYRSELTNLKMQFNLTTGAGTGSVDPFLFSGTVAEASNVQMQAIGNGNGGEGTLVFGSIDFDYGPTLGIPVYLVADAAGMFGAVQGGLTVGQVITGGALSSTDDPMAATSFAGYMPNNGRLGPIPFAMTTLDVLQDGDADNLCGTVGGSGVLDPAALAPGNLCDDGVSGVRMGTAPFPGHGANFDMTSMTVTKITDTSIVPVPAAVWLFGSGLLGLVGVARRKAAA